MTITNHWKTYFQVCLSNVTTRIWTYVAPLNDGITSILYAVIYKPMGSPSACIRAWFLPDKHTGKPVTFDIQIPHHVIAHAVEVKIGHVYTVDWICSELHFRNDWPNLSVTVQWTQRRILGGTILLSSRLDCWCFPCRRFFFCCTEGWSSYARRGRYCTQGSHPNLLRYLSTLQTLPETV